MSEFKFNCPACGQHLQADASSQGAQIHCPVCQAPVTVPTFAPLPTVAIKIAANETTPGAAPQQSMPRVPLRSTARPQPSTCGLAIASLVLAIATVVIGPFGYIPGIICGHLAKSRIRRNPGLGGKGLATAGLGLGYGFVVATILILLAFLSIFFKAARRLQADTKFPTGLVTQQPPAAMDSGSGIASEGWTTNLSTVATPGTLVAGRVHGRPFICDRAELSPFNNPQFLTLQQGEGLQGSLKITVIIGDRVGLDGRTISIPRTFDIPADLDYRIGILWRENGQYHTQQFGRNFSGFVLRLQCQPRVNDLVKGQIYLCLGDAQKSYVAGSFEAKLR
jgi:hypothetical protein